MPIEPSLERCDRQSLGYSLAEEERRVEGRGDKDGEGSLYVRGFRESVFSLIIYVNCCCGNLEIIR
jgi:hypothetical protein